MMFRTKAHSNTVKMKNSYFKYLVSKFLFQNASFKNIVFQKVCFRILVSKFFLFHLLFQNSCFRIHVSKFFYVVQYCAVLKDLRWQAFSHFFRFPISSQLARSTYKSQGLGILINLWSPWSISGVSGVAYHVFSLAWKRALGDWIVVCEKALYNSLDKVTRWQSDNVHQKKLAAFYSCRDSLARWAITTIVDSGGTRVDPESVVVGV